MAVNLQVGGAVRAGAWYGLRPADLELPALLRSGGLGIVLAPRQMGKSSLRLRAAARLASDTRVAQVDLAGLGTEGVTPGEWFTSLAAEIAAELGQPEPTLAGAPARGWLTFLGDLLDEPVVLFLDELDVLRRLPFAEDVLGAVRAAHERSAVDPRWARLGLCLLGAASPEALGVPLNVGHRVALQDFERPALTGLRELLSPGVVDAIYAWTAGHPYMTLRIGAAAGEDRVDDLVERFFLATGASDTNLAASEREVLVADGGEVERVETYRRALGGPIPLAAVRPAVRDALVLSGLLAVRGGQLWPRNRIVATVFDAAWAERVLGRRSIRAAVRRWTDSAHHDEELPQGRELAAHRAWAEGRADLSPDEHALLRRAGEVAAEQAARSNAVTLARTRGWMVAALSGVGAALAFTAVALVRERDVAREETLRATELRLAAEAVSLAGTPRLGEQALGRALAAADLDPAADPPEVTRAVAEALSAMSGRRLHGHGAAVVGVGCSPDGAITSVDRDGVVLTWAGGAPTRGGVPPGNPVEQPGEVEGPDGRGPERLRRLVGPGVELRWERELAVVVADDGTTLPLVGHTGSGLRWASFTELGLLTLGHDDTLRRWDARTGAPLGAFVLHEREPNAVVRCGLQVVTGAEDRTVGVWELLGGAGRAVALTDRAYIGAAWSGTSVLTVDQDGHPHRIDPDTGASVSSGPPALHPWEQDPSGQYRFDGDLPAIHGPDGEQRFPPLGEPALYASWSPDGKRVAGSTPSGSIYVWEGDRPPLRYEGPTSLPCRPVFGPRGLAVGDDDGGLWYLDTGEHVQAHSTRVSSLAWAADGRVATASLDHTVALWDGTVRVGQLVGHASHVRAVAWSPDGTRLATSGDDLTVRLWSDAGAELAVLRGHTAVVRSVAFSPDGERVVSASDDGVVIVWPGSVPALLAAAREAFGAASAAPR